MSFRGTLLTLSSFCALVVATGAEPARAFTDADRGVYAAAVNFCRTRPAQKFFDEVTHIVCFDGQIVPNEDVSFIQRLPEHGVFVVRSAGGWREPAERIAMILREKHADVLVYDYCLSACASVLFVASDRTYVVKDSIVAWHYGSVDNDTCGRVDPGRGLTRIVCSTGQSVDWPRLFAGTVRPMSTYVSRILVGYFKGTGVFHDIFWTWHPRYYKPVLRTEIEYEAYPDSQDELDDLSRRLLGAWGKVRIIYDP